jgi:3-hydroxyacyl-CoA dehydrogenase/enoyl-CoA hydratase/3-hydroxybutyryl-CoA epimerase
MVDTGLKFEVDRDKIGWLTFDQPNAPVNVLSSAVLRDLDHLLGELESRIANGQFFALVIRSGKPGSFIAGADVREISSVHSAAEGQTASAAGQRIFRRIERLRVPTIAAVDGVCLGGGTELILHCRYRIASDSAATKIGLPEVRLGILPGFGGSVRLPRLVGIQNALGMILSGKPVTASKARRLGLVDELLVDGRFAEQVKRFVRDVITGDRPTTTRRKGLKDRLLENTPPGRRLLLSMARRRTLAQTEGHYPAPLRALEVVIRGYTLSFDEAYALESRALGELLTGDTSHNLIRVFLLSQDAKKAIPAEVLENRRPVEAAGVVGAGVMGGAIAELIAAADVPVVLTDISQEALDSGLRHANELLQKAARARVFSPEQASLKFALITGSLESAGFESVDLAIEAVVERMGVKRQVIRDLEERMAPDAVIATNTSSLSVAEMADGAEHPDRIVGLHFFNPVHKMPLVEVIRAEHTSERTLATAFGFALDLRKTPVIVADTPGFLVNRLLGPYLNEAGYLVEEGTDVGRLDGVLARFGMPMGPCRLLDEVGFDVAEHAGQEMWSAFGERFSPSGAVTALREDGRLGRKNGRGFYLYENGREKGVDPTAETLVRAAGAEASGGPADDDILARCLYLMVNEAAYALTEEVVTDADVIDLAMIMGTGFPPFRGGLLKWADGIGLETIVSTLDRYRADVGPRFEPAPLLASMAKRGATFTHTA